MVAAVQHHIPAAANDQRHRHQHLPLQATAAEAEVGRDRGAGGRHHRPEDAEPDDAAVDPKKSRRHRDNRAAATGISRSPRARPGAAQSSTAPEPERDSIVTPQPANDDGKPKSSAIVTMRRVGEDMTSEEHKRRGNAADALFQDMKRKINGKGEG